MNKEGSHFLRFLYQTPPGRICLKIMINPVVSRIGGVYMDMGASKAHIDRFIRRNGIDMTQYETARYRSFNEFFTRKIKDGKRPVDPAPDSLVSPCDGRLSAYRITDGASFAIKGSRYRISDLVKGSRMAPDYKGGVCLIFRLCVDDYHRYCYPADGEIIEHGAIPGVLHTVRPVAVERYPVFVQNSREYTIMETGRFGKIAQIEVGAMMIGRILNYKSYGAVTRGEEKGMFLYGGSTIVLLIPHGAAGIPEYFFNNTEKGIETLVKYGSSIGRSLK